MAPFFMANDIASLAGKLLRERIAGARPRARNVGARSFVRAHPNAIDAGVGSYVGACLQATTSVIAPVIWGIMCLAVARASTLLQK